MARPVKQRRICGLPCVNEFFPCTGNDTGQIHMSVDEYESIRLIDYLGFSQEDCAARMNVARTTVQSIYDGARKKLAQVLVEGKRLKVSGGPYTLCQYADGCCGMNCKKPECAKKLCQRGQKKFGGITMIIAVTYENGQVFQHFGHCENFKIYHAERNEIQSSQIVNAAGSGHGALAGFLKKLGVQVLICGGIGGGARTALAEAGISLYPGVTGDADASVTAMLDGTLDYNPDTTCSHHHHEDGHSCGEHKCI